MKASDDEAQAPAQARPATAQSGRADTHVRGHCAAAAHSAAVRLRAPRERPLPSCRVKTAVWPPNCAEWGRGVASGAKLRIDKEIVGEFLVLWRRRNGESCLPLQLAYINGSEIRELFGKCAT